PGCGSRTLDPGVADDLAVRLSGDRMRSRRIELGELEDEAEAMFERGWTDGLPVVTPTEARVLRMLAGTSRPPDDVVAVVPPDLVVRNAGGGRPGGVDRATLGNPGKYTFCFAEDEDGSPWESLAAERGVAPAASAVTLFAGEGPRGIVDQASRTPESLARSFAGVLLTVAHPKLVLAFDAIV